MNKKILTVLVAIGLLAGIVQAEGQRYPRPIMTRAGTNARAPGNIVNSIFDTIGGVLNQARDLIGGIMGGLGRGTSTRSSANPEVALRQLKQRIDGIIDDGLYKLHKGPRQEMRARRMHF